MHITSPSGRDVALAIGVALAALAALAVLDLPSRRIEIDCSYLGRGSAAAHLDAAAPECQLPPQH